MRQKVVNKEKTFEQALQSLMRLCARAERSSVDIFRLLARWGVEESRRQEILDKLIEMRFVDDGRYAKAYVRDKLCFEGWGKRKIRASLSMKGIPREIIDEALGNMNNDKERLEKILSAKIRSVKYSSDYELKMKLIRFAIGRGYEYDEIVECLRHISDKYEEDEN